MRSSFMHRNPRRHTTARKEDEEKMKNSKRLFSKDMLILGFVLQLRFMFLAVIFSIFAGGYLYAATPVLIAEENFEGVMSCKLSSVGSFPVSPGIKTGMGVGGSSAYGFGRSSCGANAWDGYVNDLTFTFSKKCVITKVEFWEIERYENWGSQGWLIANGNKINDTTFGRLPSNDRIADSSFRKREFSLDIVSSGITFRCWDITDRSELFVDDIKIYGYIYDDTFTVAFNANGGVGDAIPIQGFSVNTPQKIFKNVYIKDGYVFQGWVSNSVERAELAAAGIIDVDYTDEQEITVDSDMTLYAVWRQISTSAEVVINFKKEATEFDLNCDKAWWICYDTGAYGVTGFGVRSGESVSLPVGTYTLEFHSGETAFADPAPIQIVVDGTRGRIEQDVLITRKMVRFNCIFYNQSDRDRGMQPNTDQMDLNPYCKWRLGSDEWRASGKSVEVPTGAYNLEFRIDDKIGLMVNLGVIAKAITLDGTETSHTEYINALGPNGAKVSFRFKRSSTKFYPPAFDESKVFVSLLSSRGSMKLNAGEYCLPQGRYSASFQYVGDEADLWQVPTPMVFGIEGKDKDFTLNFVDSDDMLTRSVNIWFDANGGTVDTPLLKYASSWQNGNRTSLEYVPEAHRDGFDFTGWYLHKTGNNKLVAFVPSYDDADVEKTHVFGEDDSINGTPAIHVYARWTNMTPSWMSRFLSIFTASSGDIATAAAMTAANGCRTVGECYALGINPEDPNDDLKISHFEIKDGKPVITLNHTEDGSGNSFVPRVRTLGKANLNDTDWIEVPESGDPSLRFFKVEVEMP